MEKRAFLISVALSALSMYLVYQYISGEEAELIKNYGKENFKNVVVASRDILQYETIRPTDINVIQIPRAVAPGNRIDTPSDVIDAVAAVPIASGEFVLDNKIISKNVYSGLDTQIALGKRAISIPVSPKSSLNYLIRPGNRIDLAAHFEYKTPGHSISEVKVFMQDLLVLASGRTIQSAAPSGVDQSMLRSILEQVKKSAPKMDEGEVKETFNFAKTDPAYQTITLEVTPTQAQQLVYVMATFADSLVILLRHVDDRQLAHVETTNLEDVMGEDSYMVRSNRVPPPKAIPRIRFYDFVGEQRKGVE
ncbi:MAG: Flp pilus assembly protein CpaB [Deltaproteobacteria bacterium]|nr:Flp pilus assembly protein CpaB [Deltaproteobacteria bacterium]